MQLTIKAGSHFTSGFRRWLNALPWVGKREISRRVSFDDSCVYDSPAYNQDDVNKLFGLSFGFKLRKDVRGKWDFGTHWNSARFGWVWSDKYQLWKLLAYVYREGVLQHDEQLRFPEVCRVKRQEEAEHLTIQYNSDEWSNGGPHFHFSAKVLGVVSVTQVKTVERLPHYGQRLGFYFGGARVTPHQMSARVHWI